MSLYTSLIKYVFLYEVKYFLIKVYHKAYIILLLQIRIFHIGLLVIEKLIIL